MRSNYHDEDLDIISPEEADTLAQALGFAVGYHKGTADRHQFEAALDTLADYGLTLDETKADVENKKVQADLLTAQESNG